MLPQGASSSNPATRSDGVWEKENCAKSELHAAAAGLEVLNGRQRIRRMNGGWEYLGGAVVLRR